MSSLLANQNPGGTTMGETEKNHLESLIKNSRFTYNTP